MMKWRQVTKDEYKEAFGLEGLWMTEECAPTVLVIEHYERLGSFAMWTVGLILGVIIGWAWT